MRIFGFETGNFLPLSGQLFGMQACFGLVGSACANKLEDDGARENEDDKHNRYEEEHA